MRRTLEERIARIKADRATIPYQPIKREPGESKQVAREDWPGVL